jgi:hypothetical protein
MTDLQQLPPSARGGGKVSGVALLLVRSLPTLWALGESARVAPVDSSARTN